MPFTAPPTHLSRPTLTGTFAMAASTNWISTGVANSVLERGGNAYDAVVAAGFAAHIVEPHLNGPGGDLVAVVAPAGAEPSIVVGQGPAPRGATIDHFRSAGIEYVPGSGALSAAVPGAFEAWLWILRELGTWDIADVLEYTIDYAEQGVPLAPLAAKVINAMADHFNEHWSTSADTWLVDGAAPVVGDIVAQPVYARTLRRLLGRAGSGDRLSRIDAVLTEWKHGFVATVAAEACARPHRHSDGRDHAGVLDAQDFAAFAVTAEAPLSIDFRGHTVHKAGFWNQGPMLLQVLGILDHFDAADLDPSSERGAHTVLEALKLAMADRDAYYGDAMDDPGVLHELLSAEYAKGRAALIGAEASGEWRPGTIAGATPYAVPLRTDADDTTPAVAGIGEPTVARDGETKGDTVHLDIVDRWGNMVSVTPSGGWLQGNPIIAELGFCLGTRLQMTWLDETAPSALKPGRRPRTTLTPTIVSRDGEAVCALGSPGGDQQDQWQLLYLLRTIVGGYTPQEAIDSPMFHTTAAAGSFWPRHWVPRGAVVEDRLGEDVIDGLRLRGHDVTVSGPWSLGRLSAVTRDPATGRLAGAANPRGAQGYAAGR